MGLASVVAPVLIAHAIAADIDLAGVAALAFTSAAGVRTFAGASPRRDLPVFAVGGATATAAREQGFAHVLASQGDVGTLADLIAAARPALVLAPTAREPAADLPALLAARGVAARSVVVYETVPADVTAPGDIDAVLIHSPRAARIVADLITAEQATALTVFAISEAAAAPLRALPFAQIAVAPFPDEASLLHLLEG